MATPALQAQFEQQIEQHRKVLYKISRSYAQTREDQEDLAQEILVQLWRSFARFDGRSLFLTWMYRVALNTAISFARREFTQKRYVVSIEDRLLAALPDRPPETGEETRLYDILQQLDPLPRALLLLYLDGNRYQEIADVLGISPTNVATRLSRLKETLRDTYAKRKVNLK